MKRGDKRAISTLVATVLLILITIAGVAIIWTVIVPMLKNSLDTPQMNTDLSVVSSGGYTVYDSANNLATVQVKRGADNANLSGVQVIFSVAGNTYKSIVPAPNTNQAQTYTFNMSRFGSPDTVSVAPIYKTGNSETPGVIISKTQILSGTLSEIPSIIFNATGDNRGTICTPQCPSASSTACGQQLNSTNNCGFCSGTGTYCASGTCNSSGQCSVPCSPICPAPNTVTCGQQITPTNSCGSCTGTGTFCATGTCNSTGQCFVPSPTNIPITDCLFSLTSSSLPYVLSNNLSATSTCLNIAANNVILDCVGYSINGNTGIYGVNVTGYNNVIIKNCIFNNFNVAVYASKASNVLVDNNTINMNSVNSYGIWFYNKVNFSKITNSQIYVTGGNYLNSRGVRIEETSSSSSNNIVYLNTINGTNIGIDLYYSGYNNVSRNNITNIQLSGGAAVNIYQAAGNSLYYNIINNSYYGIYSGGSNSNNSDIEYNNISIANFGIEINPTTTTPNKIMNNRVCNYTSTSWDIECPSGNTVFGNICSKISSNCAASCSSRC